MYRFPLDLDLSYLLRRQISYIGIDQYNIYLTLNAEILSADRRPSGVLENVVMDSDVHITVSGPWSLAAESGSVIDHSMEHAERKSYQIHVLLGLRMVGYTVVSETTLELKFENGFCLSVVDDSPYENVIIRYGDTLIIA